MSFQDIAGHILHGMGPGILGGIGEALLDHKNPESQDPKAPDPQKPGTAKPNAFKYGGVVQKTGVALVHKGETITPNDHDGDEPVNLSHHRVVMHLNKGGLHRALGIPEDQAIPPEKIEAARNSKNPHMREMANLAHSMAKWHHVGASAS